MYILFWSIFGVVETERFYTEVGYEAIAFAGLTLYAIYQAIAGLVVLNMLIAILNDAYVKTTVSTSL